MLLVIFEYFWLQVNCFLSEFSNLSGFIVETILQYIGKKQAIYRPYYLSPPLNMILYL